MKPNVIYQLKLQDSIKTQKQEILSGKKLKRDTIESLNALYEGTEIVLNAFKSRIF